MRRFPQVAFPHYALGWRVYEYAGNLVVGHHGGVRGSRSLILFDPKLKTGVVALWNSANGRPAALEIEVMDMVYGLPPSDWLMLDTPIPAPIPPPEEVPPLETAVENSLANAVQNASEETESRAQIGR